MGVREIDGKWHTVNKAGKVGKRGFSKKASAEAAQARGLAMAASSPLGLGERAQEPIAEDFSGVETTEERKALGIPPKRVPKDPESF